MISLQSSAEYRDDKQVTEIKDENSRRITEKGGMPDKFP
jgi:hypothetical protein